MKIKIYRDNNGEQMLTIQNGLPYEGHQTITINTAEVIVLEVGDEPRRDIDLTRLCNWGVGGEVANGCENYADGSDGLCTKHLKAYEKMTRMDPEA